MTRKQLLETTEQAVCKDRQATHGKPEQTFAAIASLWNAYLTAKAHIVGEPVTVSPTDVACMMTLFKIARSIGNPQNPENWIDQAGYAVCGGEIATEGNPTRDSEQRGEIGHAIGAEIASLQMILAENYDHARMLGRELTKKLGITIPTYEWQFLDQAVNSPASLTANQYNELKKMATKYLAK